MLLVQANNEGFGTIAELQKCNLTELRLMLRFKNVWREWSEDNNSGGRNGRR